MSEAQPIDESSTGLAVEELSARTGAPVRTIREYQTWQILHPPTRVGRRGYYDESHVRRLEGIARLQERGYSIAAIRDLFDAWEQGAGLRDVLGVDDAIGLPADEAPIAISRAQLAGLVPAIASSDRLLARAVKLRLIVPDDEGYLARSPALVQLVADAIAAGLSATAALDLVAAVTDAADATGEAAAEIVAFGVDHGEDVEPLLRRGRVLLARAVATHTIDRVGHHLLEQSADRPELADLVAGIRIGSRRGPDHGNADADTIGGSGLAVRSDHASTERPSRMAEKSPSQLIDERIEELDDWRGTMLSQLRAVVKEADPDVVEEWKWRGVPTWTHDGIICTGETYKSVVKMTFFKGASLNDSGGLFNSSLEGNTRRAIDFHEGEKIDKKALKALVRAAVALNKPKAKR